MDRANYKELIVVLSTLVDRIMFTYHNGNCHAGTETTLESCRRKFYF